MPLSSASSAPKTAGSAWTAAAGPMTCRGYAGIRTCWRRCSTLAHCSASTRWPPACRPATPVPARALPPAGLRNQLLPLLGPGHLDRLRDRARPPRQPGRHLTSLTRPDLRSGDREARLPGPAGRVSHRSMLRASTTTPIRARTSAAGCTSRRRASHRRTGDSVVGGSPPRRSLPRRARAGSRHLTHTSSLQSSPSSQARIRDRDTSCQRGSACSLALCIAFRR